MKHKTWGGRFKKPLDPRVLKFHASLPFDWRLYEADIAGSIAHTKMLEKQGFLTNVESLKITTALAEIKKAIDDDALEWKDECEDIHMMIEDRLIEKIGDTGKKLHTGRSRNDQVALDLRLFLKASCKEIHGLMKELLNTLNHLSQEHHDTWMPGYTHLQHAQPIRFGTYWNAYFEMLERDIERLQQSYERLNHSPLGAGALAGSSLYLDRYFVAMQLGFDGIVHNTLDAVSSRDFILEFMNIASLIMMNLSRLSEDLILWSSQEFGFVLLDDAFATGSSLMPNKKNPDVLELIRGKTGRVYGNMMAMFTVMKGLPLSYNKDMQEDKESLFDTVDTLIACLSILPPFLSSLQFNTEKMKAAASHSHLRATHLVEVLVKSGVSFRDAHHQVGAWISESLEHDVDLAVIANQAGFCIPNLGE